MPERAWPKHATIKPRYLRGSGAVRLVIASEDKKTTWVTMTEEEAQELRENLSEIEAERTTS